MPRSPDRFVDGRPMLMGGLRRTHTFANAGRDIPAQWAEFARMLPLPGQVGQVTYGVMAGGDEAARIMEYMCAGEVASFDELPAGTGRMRVPPAHYAVFEHSGPIAGIADAWTDAHGWLGTEGWDSAHQPDFERYDERYDPRTQSGHYEIWVAVKPAADGAAR